MDVLLGLLVLAFPFSVDYREVEATGDCKWRTLISLVWLLIIWYASYKWF